MESNHPIPFYPISSLISASHSSVPFLPASLSNLGVTFTSSDLPPTSIAQRRARAPIISTHPSPSASSHPATPQVSKASFDPYLNEIILDYSKWERDILAQEKRNDKRELKEQRKSLAFTTTTTTPTVAQDDHDDTDRETAHEEEEENLPPLSGVPQIFFDPNFNLSNPRTFDLVTERISLSSTSTTTTQPQNYLLPSSPTSPTQATNGNGNLDSTDPDDLLPGLGPITLADLASDQILQEKLSHYTAIIESHLVKEIGLKSSSFFEALSNLQSLHTQGSECLSKIKELQFALAMTAPTENGEIEKFGVGGVAKKGIQILRNQARRRGLERIDNAVRIVREVWEALDQAKSLVEMGRWMDAVEVVDEVEEMFYSSGSNTNPESSIHLSKLSSLKSLPSKLNLLRQQIAKSLEVELVAVLENLTERTTRDFVKLSVGDGGNASGTMKITTSSKEEWKEEARERAKERTRPIVQGLVRADGMDVAVAAWRETVLKEVRGLVREHLPSGESNDSAPTGDEEDALGLIANGRSSVELASTSSVSEKSVSLAKRLRAMPHSAFLSLAQRTYLGLLGTIEAVDLHAKVLLELVSEIKAKQLPPPPTIPPPSSLPLPPRSSSLFVPQSSSSPSQLTSTPPSSSSTIAMPSTSSSEESALAADLSDVIHAAAELANLRFSKVIGVRTDAHSQLSLTEFLEIFDSTWNFVLNCEILCRRMIVGLRGVMVGQFKTWLNNFHQVRLNQSAKRVEEELWVNVEVGWKTQAVIERILECAVKDPEYYVLGKRREDKGLGERRLTLEDNAEWKVMKKQLEIEGREYFAVAAGLRAVEVLEEYMMVVVNCQMLTTDAMSKVVEFLKSFNSRTCQVVLGAGAMRSAGLKNITAKHLALASQALSIMISLIPYVRETLRRHLNPKQAVMLVEFDKLRRDYQEHQNEIHSKLVAIMSDRLQIHCKTLETIDWEEAQPNRKEGQPNPYMESLVKEHTTLHKVLSRFLQISTVEYIMAQVFSALNAKLAEEFGKFDIQSEDARRRMLVDVSFMKNRLAELKGLERETPGVELEHLIESKQTPASLIRPISTHTSTSERPQSLPPIPHLAAPLAPPELIPSPSIPIPTTTTSTPSVVEPPAVAPLPTVVAPATLEPASLLPVPSPPPPPIRRKSMAERLSELARRRPSAATIAQATVLPTVSEPVAAAEIPNDDRIERPIYPLNDAPAREEREAVIAVDVPVGIVRSCTEESVIEEHLEVATAEDESDISKSTLKPLTEEHSKLSDVQDKLEEPQVVGGEKSLSENVQVDETNPDSSSEIPAVEAILRNDPEQATGATDNVNSSPVETKESTLSHPSEEATLPPGLSSQTGEKDEKDVDEVEGLEELNPMGEPSNSNVIVAGADNSTVLNDDSESKDIGPTESPTATKLSLNGDSLNIDVTVDEFTGGDLSPEEESELEQLGGELYEVDVEPDEEEGSFL